jgi:hypothetical protein
MGPSARDCSPGEAHVTVGEGGLEAVEEIGHSLALRLVNSRYAALVSAPRLSYQPHDPRSDILHEGLQLRIRIAP